MNKGSLTRTLDQLKSFTNSNQQLEQYRTDSGIAADLLWQANLAGDIEEKHVVDLGAGTGVLAIGAALLGASRVSCVEIDPDAIRVLEDNLAQAGVQADIIHGGVQSIDCDTVVMNPPFGNVVRGADKPFLEAAMKSGAVVYSIHPRGSELVIDQLCTKHGFERTHTIAREMALPATQRHHTKKLHRTPVILVRLEKQPL